MARIYHSWRSVGKSRDETDQRKVKKRKWKMIGHILRQDQDHDINFAFTWALERRRKGGRTPNKCRRTVEGKRREEG